MEWSIQLLGGDTKGSWVSATSACDPDRGGGLLVLLRVRYLAGHRGYGG